mgnify:CR=1 FL=1
MGQSQCEQILSYLKAGNSITSWGAFTLFHITRISGRIYDLKKAGHKIIKEMVHNPETRTRYAKYSLTI